MINDIKSNLSKYFVDDPDYLGVTDKTDFIKACDETYKNYEIIMNSDDKSREAFGIKGDSGNWTIDVSMVLNNIMENYAAIAGTNSYDTNDDNKKIFPLRDTSSAAWTNWYNEFKTRTDAYKTAESEYKLEPEKAILYFEDGKSISKLSEVNDSIKENKSPKT